MDEQIYHQQKKGDVEYHNISMSCCVEMFHKIPQNKQHYTNLYGVLGLIRNYYLYFEPKLGQGKKLN